MRHSIVLCIHVWWTCASCCKKSCFTVALAVFVHKAWVGMAVTYTLKERPVEYLPINRVLFNLPVSSVHDVAMLAAHDQATAVWNGVGHSQW